jgi:hypothetical protein
VPRFSRIVARRMGVPESNRWKSGNSTPSPRTGRRIPVASMDWGYVPDRWSLSLKVDRHSRPGPKTYRCSAVGTARGSVLVGQSSHRERH